MRISYQIICDFWSQNKKLLIIWQIVFLLLAGIYLMVTPKTYEAYFQVRTAKILVNEKWEALKWARYTRRNLMSPQAHSDQLVQACMGSEGNAVRRSLVNSMRIDVIDDSGGALAISIRLIGDEKAKKCAEMLAETIVKDSDAALVKRLNDEGFVEGNTVKGKINKFEKPFISSQVQMSDSFVRPKWFHVYLSASLLGFVGALAFAILRRRYRSE
jgi:capsular polysaccharide biosynthesis protein